MHMFSLFYSLSIFYPLSFSPFQQNRSFDSSVNVSRASCMDVVRKQKRNLIYIYIYIAERKSILNWIPIVT